MTIGQRICQLRELHGLTQRELGQVIGVSDKTISSYEKSLRMPRLDRLAKLADYFGVPLDDMSPRKDTEKAEKEAFPPRPRNVTNNVRVLSQIPPLYEPLVRRIPVLGRVPAGVPIEAVADVVEEITLSGHMASDGYDYFGLLVMGDSMYPEYRDGDVVILRIQATAETGDDVVAYIGREDATLKRLTVTECGIQLRPLNPAYDIRAFSHDEVLSLPVTIAGIVVEQRRMRR